MQDVSRYRSTTLDALSRAITPTTTVIMPLNLSLQHWVVLVFDVAAKEAFVLDPLLAWVRSQDQKCIDCPGYYMICLHTT